MGVANSFMLAKQAFRPRTAIQLSSRAPHHSQVSYQALYETRRTNILPEGSPANPEDTPSTSEDSELEFKRLLAILIQPRAPENTPVR